jgi:general secretion pathway protein G
MYHVELPALRRALADRRRAGQAGFTLIELMIVLAIIAMLAALIGPELFSKLGSSQIKTTREQVELLGTALDSFRLDIGRYPNQTEGLDALVTRPVNMLSWSGPYLRKRDLPKDAWGNPFIYEIPPHKGGIGYDLYSLGPTGKAGGEGDNKEIGNWQ